MRPHASGRAGPRTCASLSRVACKGSIVASRGGGNIVENVTFPKSSYIGAARTVPMVLAIAAVLALGLPRAARAQTPPPTPLCGLEVKEELAKALSSVVDAPDDH